MAFRTRKVTIKALNDSKQIALLVYITTFELIVLAVLAIGLREWHIVYRAVFGGAMFVAATIYLSVVFIPRVSSWQALCKHYITNMLQHTHFSQ